MKRVSTLMLLSAAVVLVVLCGFAVKGYTAGSESRIQRGMQIAPVSLNVQGKNRAQVYLGSYLVNAVSTCNDCHTCPSYAAGHKQVPGQNPQVNAENYLAGGVPFGPFMSANITPDENGLPAGLTWEQFRTALRTGHEPNGDFLFVMPWPVFRHMTDHDLHAIYTYLTAIPHATPGSCGGAGE